MRNYKLTGVVIKRMNVHEADRIITFFSKEKGLVDLKAKGVRKITGKLKGALELFTKSDLELAQGKSLDVITGAQHQESFGKVRDSLLSTSALYYITESLINFLNEEQQEKEIYALFLKTLHLLNRENIDKTKRQLLIANFLIKLLKFSGYEPELYSCLKCSSKINSDKKFFHPIQGGVICGSCQPKKGIRLTDSSLKLMRLLSDKELSEIKKIKIPLREVKKTADIINTFIESIIERDIKSKDFLSEVHYA